MLKRKVTVVLLVLLSLLWLVGVAGAIEGVSVPEITIVTESPLVVDAGQQFAVSVQIEFLEDINSIQLFAHTAKDKKNAIAESAVINNLKSDVSRKVVLYGTIKNAGLTDISQIRVEYNDGVEKKSEFYPVDAFLIKVLEPESKPVVLGTPRVFLKNYTLSQGSILAGNTFNLTLYVENSSSREVRNLKISLATIPSEDSTSGTVFSPVDSSNSFYVERIGAKSTYTKSIKLFVDPNATAKTYLVPVEILYEDQQGVSYTVSEMVNIPVLQESRLQVLSVEIPPMAAVGEAMPVTAEFVNVGKVALKNLLITVEGDFPKENASYFLANFEIGQSDFYQAYIIPEAEGLLEGKVVFRYLDYTNQEVVEEWPFEIEVQQVAMPGPGGPEEPKPVDSSSSAPLFVYILGAVLLALATVGVVLRRRKVKRGEIFDEEL